MRIAANPYLDWLNSDQAPAGLAVTNASRCDKSSLAIRQVNTGKPLKLTKSVFRQPKTGADRRKHRQSLSWQIQSMAIIGVLGFFVFLAVMLGESKDRAYLLQNIKNIRYPMQQSLLAASHELAFIHSNLEHAVISRDTALLDNAMGQASRFREHLHTALLLGNTHALGINAVLRSFDHYFDNAHALSLATITGEPTSETLESAKLNASKYQLVADALQALTDHENQALRASVSAATARANDSLRLGLTTGLLTAVLLFFTAFVTSRGILQRINNMVSSLKSIAVGNGDINVRIPLTGSDEMTELAFWFNTFLDKLQQVTTESTREIKRLAFTDTLTNLPNRRMFLRCLNAESERQQANPGTKLAVMFLDLDNFKPVNDQLGHDAGDELIREVANRLINTVREEDVISRATNPDEPELGQPVVARLAGDEFMLIVSDLQTAEQAALVAERIRVALLKPYLINGMQFSIGVSIGICLSPDNAIGANDLVTFADMAMYEAKKNGKNTYRFFDPALREASEHKVKMDNAIKLAIANEELHLLFQPKIRLSDGKPVGAEALLRWQHPELGIFTPDDFIAQAEANGQICEMDEWVLGQVFDYLAEWEEDDLEPASIALNFSATQASRRNLVDTVRRIAGDNQHLARYIEIEITETSALQNLEFVEQNIRMLKAMGIKIAMDDFGAGHSSLALLTRCSIDTLKIDKAVTSEIQNDQKSRHIVHSIIDLATKLQVSTVAEGVEDQAQAQTLAAMNCDYAQGYLYSKPLSAREFKQWMIENTDIDEAA